MKKLAVLLGVALVTGCGQRTNDTALRSAELKGANVLLVTIDTLRRDRVGAYGNGSGLTPTLDQLSARGLRYRRAYSHVPMTLPAHTSILTGLTPRRHGVRNNTTFRLDEGVPTLATLLKTAGYRTGAFVGAFVLDARFGLNRGFDEYDDRLPHRERASFHFAERRAGEVVKLAGDWILKPSVSQQPWFAWVHLFDPHAPYDAPAEYRSGRAPYDAEVAYADAMLGQLLDRLRVARALDRTLIVVTADHGESLGEHGETTHGLFAYDATIAVPLIVNGAPIGAGVVDAPVAHMDIAPTILDLVGVPVPDRLDGQSLVRPPSRSRPVYFEALDAYLTRDWAPLSGLVQDDCKYIELPLPELYDLSSDPGEQHNRVGHDERGEILRRALPQLDSGPGSTARAVAVDRDAAARLRSLGYVGSSPATSRRKTGEADDPKRLVGLNERFNSALTAFDEGRSDAALADFLAILRERPDFVAARTSAATVLLQQKRSREAVDLLQAAPPDQAESGELLAKLGAALRDAGDLPGATAAFEHARQAGDQNAELLNDLAVAYAGLGRSSDARALFRQQLARESGTGAATTWYNLGLLELQGKRRREAADAFRHAVQIEPGYGAAWQALGAALVGLDSMAAADALRHAERLQPGDFDLLFNLAMVLAESDKPSEAIPYLQRFAREAPRDRYGADIARVQAMLARLERLRERERGPS